MIPRFALHRSRVHYALPNGPELSCGNACLGHSLHELRFDLAYEFYAPRCSVSLSDWLGGRAGAVETHTRFRCGELFLS